MGRAQVISPEAMEARASRLGWVRAGHVLRAGGARARRSSQPAPAPPRAHLHLPLPVPAPHTGGLAVRGRGGLPGGLHQAGGRRARGRHDHAQKGARRGAAAGLHRGHAHGLLRPLPHGCAGGRAGPRGRPCMGPPAPRHLPARPLQRSTRPTRSRAIANTTTRLQARTGTRSCAAQGSAYSPAGAAPSAPPAQTRTSTRSCATRCSSCS